MTSIDKQIAALELLLEDTDTDDPIRMGLEARLAYLRAQAKAVFPDTVTTPLDKQSGGVSLRSAQVERIDKIVGQDDVAGDKVLGDKHAHTMQPLIPLTPTR